MVPRGGQLPPAVLRALEGIADGSGRTVVIAGPEASGKSAALAAVVEELERTGVTVRSLVAQYRERTSPFAVVAPLVRGESRTPPSSTDTGEAAIEGGIPPLAAFGLPDSGPPPSRRARGDLQRGRVLGTSFAVRSRGVEHFDAGEYWRELRAGFDAGSVRALAITVEDAVFADEESLNFLAFLSERARLVPLLIVLVLDTSNAASRLWEDRLAGRLDVEWHRLKESRIDPREEVRVRRLHGLLPATSKRAVGLLAILGGSASDVQLARVCRLTFPELADALLPALEARLVRTEGNRILVAQRSWTPTLVELVPPEQRAGLEEEVRTALEAMTADPTPAQRRDLASRLAEGRQAPEAMQALSAAAEEAARASDFDQADALLVRADAQRPSLPPADQRSAEARIGLRRAAVLFLSGRSPEACESLGEGLEAAVQARLPTDRLGPWLDALVPAMLLVGPRPNLLGLLAEGAERLEAAEMLEPAALLQFVVADLEATRGRLEPARHAAHRAARLAQRAPADHLRATALAAVGTIRAHDSAGRDPRAERYLRSAELSFASLLRPELEFVVAARVARLLVDRGDGKGALEIHGRVIETARRIGQPAIELEHQLGLAELGLDAGPSPRTRRAIARAGELVERLSLTPPSPSLVRWWILSGRVAAIDGADETAADRWTAASTRRGPTGAPR
ncbi:MAG TPA: AAA family ATPase, partial [Thermoplasmata archaeon]|nr:AAA family ATPase [Thermoplasmata archaeon]